MMDDSDENDPVEDFQMFPTNATIEFNYARPEGCIFFRTTLATELKFITEDFQFLYEIEKVNSCGRPLILIKKFCDGVWFDFYKGRLHFKNAKWDLSTCNVVGKLTTVDRYEPMFNVMDDEVDVFAATIVPRVTAGSSVGQYRMKRLYNALAQSEPDLDIKVPAGQDPGYISLVRGFVKNEINGGPNFNIEINDVIIREEVDGATPPPGSGWIDDGGKWVRPPNILDVNISQNKTAAGDQNNYFNHPKFDKVRRVRISNPLVHFKNGVKLIDIIDRLCPGNLPADLMSNFFNYNPDGQYPANYAYEYASANLDNIVLWQLSDIIRHDDSSTSKPAKKFILKLSDLLNDLRMSMNVYWDIDDDGILIFEHFSYFKWKQILFDLTVPGKRDYLIGKAQYEYLNIRPRYEKFTWGIEPKNKHFGMPRVEYFSCYEEKTEGYNARIITPDVMGEYLDQKEVFWSVYLPEYNYDYPQPPFSLGAMEIEGVYGLYRFPEDTEIDTSSFAGFVIANVKTWEGINYIPEFDVPNYQQLGNSAPVNGALSLSSMAIPLLSHDRHGDARLEGNTFNFKANNPKPTRKQVDIWVPFCCSDIWEPQNLIKTNFGICQVESATLNEPDGKLYLKPQF